MAIVYVSLGSNLGNRRNNILASIKYIKQFAKIIKKSFLYETSPVGYLDQPYFFNCAIQIETDLGPMTLLDKLKSIEKLMGRKKTVRWTNRIIDLDILFYNNSIIQTQKLFIPHKELHKRKFVLYPLEDIAPDYIHPILKKTIFQLKYTFKDNLQEIRKLYKLNS
ncbi:MAG: 2-amino-4-hydroxy-6-hydroxymethyldihydropteridine diphosphokinase [Endomicrobiia bacterium]